MQLLLTKEEVITILYNCFCDSGITELYTCGVNLDYNQKDYNTAKKKLDDPCIEDIYVQMLKDEKPLRFVDSTESVLLSLSIATENFKLPEAIRSCYAILSEDYDAYACFYVLQFALYGKIIYC